MQNQPPTAVIHSSPGINNDYSISYWFSGTDSSDPDGDPLTFSWTALGGIPGTSSESTCSFTWTKGATGGWRTVYLTVNDGNGGSATDMALVWVPAVGEY
ncbi:MAG: Ig-like domain-containing protein [bacterium]